MGYICAELRKPVEDTVYRKLLSQRADDIGYVYFVGMPLPPELSMNSSVTFIKTGTIRKPSGATCYTANRKSFYADTGRLYFSHQYGAGGRYSPYGSRRQSLP